MPNDISTDLTKKFFSKWETEDPIMLEQVVNAVSNYIGEKIR